MEAVYRVQKRSIGSSLGGPKSQLQLGRGSTNEARGGGWGSSLKTNIMSSPLRNALSVAIVTEWASVRLRVTLNPTALAAQQNSGEESDLCFRVSCRGTDTFLFLARAH